jgi:hypoxanthine phosphoribosyltransferase
MDPAPETTSAPPDREVMTWDHLGEASRHLAQVVVDSGYVPDIVLAIARGGLLPGGAVAYALGVKNSCAMNVEFYTDVDQRLEVPLILPPAPELIDLGDSKMLIVDDVADTGRTLEVVEQFCEGKVAEVRTAVLYEKSQSVVKCDYVWRRTDRWIDFPWSSTPPVEGGGSAVA